MKYIKMALPLERTMHYYMTIDTVYGIKASTRQEFVQAKKDFSDITLTSPTWIEVNEEKYDNTIFDLRFEDGEWAQ